MKKEPQRQAVFLSAEFYDRIEERVKATGFDSVDEYVTFVLEEVLKDEEEKPSRKEEREIKKRLRGLGYLD